MKVYTYVYVTVEKVNKQQCNELILSSIFVLKTGQGLFVFVCFMPSYKNAG